MKIDYGYVMVGLAGLGVLLVGGVYISRVSAPPPIVFEAVSAENPSVYVGGELRVKTETASRVEAFECVVNTQYYIRHGTEGVSKIVGRKEIVEPQRFRYTFEIPADYGAGLYAARVRENYDCPGRPSRTIDAPWVEFRIVG